MEEPPGAAPMSDDFEASDDGWERSGEMRMPAKEGTACSSEAAAVLWGLAATEEPRTENRQPRVLED